jgi:prepilin-type N-terminal cleavage/methylation domain-containing protein
MSRSLSNRGGFTLLEAVVALAIIGAVSVAVLEGLSGALRAGATAADQVTLEALADYTVARAELLPPALLGRIPDSLARGDVGPLFPGVTWTLRSRAVSDAADLYDLRVTVTSGTSAIERAGRVYRPRPSRPAP